MAGLIVCLMFVSTTVCASAAGDNGVRDNDAVADEFEQHLASVEVDDAQRDSAVAKFNSLKDESPADAVSESLLVLYPEYLEAIESADDSDDTNGLGRIATSDDPFLAADASFYYARSLMNQERYEQALPLLEEVRRQSQFSVRAGEAQYFIAVARAGMLQNAEAIESFLEFIQMNEDAPERLRVSAWRQVQELTAIEMQEGQLADVRQRMDFSRRRLQLEDTGESTQEEQDKIVSMLNRMIKEQEKKEASSSSKSKNTKKQQEKQQQQQQQQQDGEKQEQKPGESQKGGSSSNANGQAEIRQFDNSDQSPWSRLRDRSRDPANNAIKDKLPARYRDLVERYIEEVNGTAEKDE